MRVQAGNMPVGVGGGNDRRSVTRSPLLAVILSVGVLGILAVIFGGPARSFPTPLSVTPV